MTRLFTFLRSMLALVLLASGGLAQADEAQYLYDELGRLVRVIDSQGNVATYTYDAVGNLMRIDRATVGQLQPTITGISPNVGRAGSTIQVTISGTNLLMGKMTTDNPGISLLKTITTDVEVRATVVISKAARQGPTSVTVETGLGSLTVSFTVQPPAPKLIVSPTIVTLEPNGKTVALTVDLSHADVLDTKVTLRTDNPAVATVAPTQVTIPTGETSATAMVTTGVEGTTALVVEAGGGISGASIYVAAPFGGPALAGGPHVSVELRPPQQLPTFTPLVSALVTVELPSLVVPLAFTPLVAPLVSVELQAPLVPPSFTPLVSALVSVELPSPVVPSAFTPLVAPLVSVNLEAALP